MTALRPYPRQPLTERDHAVLNHLATTPARPCDIEHALNLPRHGVQSTLSKLSQRGHATRTQGGWVRT
jgi:predicted Rossmann fold nucleotide-binding protein DprA/Smf involved in DNA uptake